VGRFLARRLAHGAVVVFIAASVSFFLVHLAPGDPFSSTLESVTISQATKDRWRAEYGIDRPIAEQYYLFLKQLARGNLGPSITRPESAASVLIEAVPNTLLLMVTALVISFTVGVALGVWQAARAGSRADRAVSTASLVVAALPEFWLAVALIVVFAVHLRLLPAGGTTTMVLHDLMSPVGKILDRARHLVLPALTLALIGVASIARYQRAAVLEVLPLEFIRTARAKGLGERSVLWRHALRNALVPTIVLAGLSLPTLLGGAVFVEKIFSYPGLGWVAAGAFGARDYQVVVGATMMGAILVVVGGIVTDVLHAVIDPRVRAE
jgi:peptide/nickel transport system permease protein